MTSGGTQYRVDLMTEPFIENVQYVVWKLSKEELSLVITRLEVVGSSKTWEQLRKGRIVKRKEFHPTAVARTSTPAPIARALLRLPAYSKRHRILYHGVGRDSFGAEALTRNGRYKVIIYDPFHPDPKVRAWPRGRYREVWSVYTLNVVPFDQGLRILGELHTFIDNLEHKPETAFAMIAVRRDNS